MVALPEPLPDALPHGPEVPSTCTQSPGEPNALSTAPDWPITAVLPGVHVVPRVGRRSSSVRRPVTSLIENEEVRFPALPPETRTSANFKVALLGGTDQVSMTWVLPSLL